MGAGNIETGNLAVAMTDEPLRCLKCGYRLDGLPAPALCPECGLRDNPDLRTPQLPWASIEFLQSLGHGLRIIIASAKLFVCTVVVSYIIALVLSTIAPGAGWVVTAYEWTVLIAFAGCGSAALVGWWRSTVREQKPPKPEPSAVAKRYVRISVALLALSTPIVLLAPIWVKGGEIYPLRISHNVVVCAIITLAVAAVLHMAAAGAYLTGLGARLPDKRITIGGWIIAIPVAILVGLMALVFSVRALLLAPAGVIPFRLSSIDVITYTFVLVPFAFYFWMLARMSRCIVTILQRRAAPDPHQPSPAFSRERIDGNVEGMDRR